MNDDRVMAYVRCEYNGEDIWFTCPKCPDENRIYLPTEEALAQYENKVSCESCGTEYRLEAEMRMDLTLYIGDVLIGGE